MALNDAANDFVSAAPMELKVKAKDLVDYMNSVERAYGDARWGQGGAEGAGGGTVGGTVGGTGVSPGGLPQLSAWSPSPAATVMDKTGRVAFHFIFSG